MSERFKITDNITIECEYRNSRNGFNHFATLYRDGLEAGAVKIHYVNRTWECYEFDSVMGKLADSKLVTPAEAEAVRAYIKSRTSDRGTENLRTVAAVAGLGALFTDNQTEQNDWKKRMLEAGLGDAVDVPADWDQLDEAEKTRRLDGAIKALQEA